MEHREVNKILSIWSKHIYGMEEIESLFWHRITTGLIMGK